ncbi:S8 family peptidase [Streptomyces sp. BA2]|uniref:S8 family peptidase n=1 Tax=Streptomyces sp. BA2 TaxID=436595 RepID=UPI0013210C3D|nr:S8 family peptidase [Streptomyces sp. BA2]MWA13732.1 S8 family serine peptidase [Streptomyces sp. BA2]
MTLTRKKRLRWAGAVTAATTAAVLSAITLPANAAPADAPLGEILGAGEPGSISGSYIVTLKGGTEAPSDAGKGLAAKYGAEIRHTYSTALNGYAVRVSSDQAKKLAGDSKVASVVQDSTVSLDHTQKNPPSWGLDRIDQKNLPLDKSYTSPESSGQGVTTYVIDTGIRTSHQDFGGRASSGWDFIDNDATAQDGNGHGTHVSATVAGESHGVAKKANVVGVRVLDDAGSGSTAQVIAGIDWVTKNAKKPAVANLSLGGSANAQLDAAVRNSIASGVTYTVAAGNDGLPAFLFSPARVKEAVTVGATDAKDARASFSNWGSSLDLFAPGVGITSAWNTNDAATDTISGTSMASPHVAGAAALYLADHPSAAPAEVSKALSDRAVPGKVTGAGLGSPNKLLQVNNP